MRVRQPPPCGGGGWGVGVGSGTGVGDRLGIRGGRGVRIGIGGRRRRGHRANRVENIENGARVPCLGVLVKPQIFVMRHPSRFLICQPVLSEGIFCKSRALVPVACGVAMEVPEAVV